MAQVLVRNLRAETVEALKNRARRQNRSLQQELKSVLEAAAQTIPQDPEKAARRIRRKLERQFGVFSDSTALVAEDRDR